MNISQLFLLPPFSLKCDCGKQNTRGNVSKGRFPFDQKFRFEISGIPYDSLRSKRSRTTRTKLGPREGVFLHSGCTKNEARAKKWKERGGGGKRRERVTFFPLPHPAPSTFLLSPHFSRGPNVARPEFRSQRSGTLATQATRMSYFVLVRFFSTDAVALLRESYTFV